MSLYLFNGPIKPQRFKEFQIQKIKEFQIFLQRDHCIALYSHVCYLHCSIMERNQLYQLFFKISTDSYSHLNCYRKLKCFKYLYNGNHCIALYFHVFCLHCGIMQINQFYCLFFYVAPSSLLQSNFEIIFRQK